MKARSLKWLLVAAVAMPGLTSAPAWAQDVPQNPVIAEGTDYGSVFNPDLAASEAVHLTNLKLAMVDATEATTTLCRSCFGPTISLQRLGTRNSCSNSVTPRKIRTAVFGGGTSLPDKGAIETRHGRGAEDL